MNKLQKIIGVCSLVLSSIVCYNLTTNDTRTKIRVGNIEIERYGPRDSFPSYFVSKPDKTTTRFDDYGNDGKVDRVFQWQEGNNVPDQAFITRDALSEWQPRFSSLLTVYAYEKDKISINPHDKKNRL